MVVHWLQFLPSTTGGMGSITGSGPKISHATQCSQKGKETNKGGVHFYEIYYKYK